jgi:peroxiredoxin Q/BCP
MPPWLISKLVVVPCCIVLLLLVVYAVTGGPARADAPLKAGDPAPDVALALDDGTTLQLSSAKRPVVLYFYPKDDTPGCTREACTFRDRKDELLKAGALVIGVSFDDAASHKRFREKHGLPFALATDDGKVAAAYGVTVRGLGIVKFHARDTFVIGADMTLKAVLRGVDPVMSVDEVLKALGAASTGDGGAPAAPTGAAKPQ